MSFDDDETKVGSVQKRFEIEERVEVVEVESLDHVLGVMRGIALSMGEAKDLQDSLLSTKLNQLPAVRLHMGSERLLEELNHIRAIAQIKRYRQVVVLSMLATRLVKKSGPLL